MAVNPKITITADDQTKAAFQSVKKNLDSMDAAAKKLSGTMDGFKNMLAGGALLGFAASVGAAVDSAMKAADAIGDLAAASGFSTETLSVLKGATEKAGQGLETMEKGVKGLAKTMDSLRSGDKDARTLMERLGLNPDEMAKIYPAEQIIKKLSDAFASFSGDRIAMGMKVFGKAGVDMIEVMDNLADGGFDKLKKEMEDLGTVVTPEAAEAANKYNESLAHLQARAESVAREFGTGLVPSLDDVARSFMDATKGSGGFFRTLGDWLGRALKGLVGFAQAVSNYVVAPFMSAYQIIELALTSGKAPSWKAFKEAAASPFRYATDATLQEWETLFGDKAATGGGKSSSGSKPRMPASGSPTVKDTSSQDISAETALLERKYSLGIVKLEQYLALRLAIINKYSTDEKKAQIERIKAYDDYDKKAVEEEKKRAEQREAILEKRWKSMDLVARTTEEMLESQKKIAENDIAALDRKQEILEIDIEAGRLSRAEEKDARINLLEERAKRLLAIADAMRQIGSVAGGEAGMGMIQFADNLTLQVTRSKAQLEVLKDEWAGVKESIGGALEGAITDFFTDIITGTKSVGDAFRAMGQAIVAEIARILAAKAAAKIVTEMGFAGGGYVAGPGTGTSDSIAARLSNGEYVMKASAVDRLGVPFLNKLNNGPGIRRDNRFATGGLVDTSRASGENGSVAMTVGLDDGLVLRQLKTSEGVKALVDVISRNRKAFGSALR